MPGHFTQSIQRVRWRLFDVSISSEMPGHFTHMDDLVKSSSGVVSISSEMPGHFTLSISFDCSCKRLSFNLNRDARPLHTKSIRSGCNHEMEVSISSEMPGHFTRCRVPTNVKSCAV